MITFKMAPSILKYYNSAVLSQVCTVPPLVLYIKFRTYIYGGNNLKESINVSYGRDKSGNEGLEFCFQWHFLWLVSCDVLEEFSNLPADRQVGELTGLIHTIAQRRKEGRMEGEGGSKIGYNNGLAIGLLQLHSPGWWRRSMRFIAFLRLTLITFLVGFLMKASI